MPKVKAEVRWDQQTSVTDPNVNRILLSFKFNQVSVLPELQIVETETFSKLFVSSHMNNQYDIAIEISLYDKVKTLFSCEKTADGFHLILNKHGSFNWPRLTRAKKMPVDYHLIYGNDGISLSHFQHVQSPSILPEVGCKECTERKNKFPLLSLPNHLLTRVTQLVSYKDITPLSHSCRRLSSICAPIVWEHFTIPLMKFDSEAFKTTGRVEEIVSLVEFLKSDKARKYIRELTWRRGRLSIPQKGFHPFVNAQIDGLMELAAAISELPNLKKLTLDMRMEVSPGYQCGLTNSDYVKLNRPTIQKDILRTIPASNTVKKVYMECAQFLTLNAVFQDMSNISSLKDLSMSALATHFPKLDYYQLLFVGRTEEDEELFGEYDKAFFNLPYDSVCLVFVYQLNESKNFEYTLHKRNSRTYERDTKGKFHRMSNISFMQGPDIPGYEGYDNVIVADI